MGAMGRWRPMKMEIPEIVIGNHRVPINPITHITRITPRFFFPMVAGVNKVNEVNLVASVRGPGHSRWNSRKLGLSRRMVQPVLWKAMPLWW